MPHRWVAVFVLCALPVMCPAARAAAPGSAPPRLADLATDRVQDLEATLKVASADEAEMARISSDFSTVYRLVQVLKEVTVQYKAPNMVRIASRNGMGELIVNGGDLYYRLGRVEKRETGTPHHRRHSLLDLNVLTRAGIDAYRSRYVRDEELEGAPTHVFALTPLASGAPRYVVWIDPATRVVLKREWRDANGKTRATFRARDVRQVAPGVWVPARIEVRNAGGKLACATTYTDVKVNQSISDDVFDAS